MDILWPSNTVLTLHFFLNSDNHQGVSFIREPDPNTVLTLHLFLKVMIIKEFLHLRIQYIHINTNKNYQEPYCFLLIKKS